MRSSQFLKIVWTHSLSFWNSLTNHIAKKDPNINEYTPEKDYVITEALQSLFELENSKFDFIFSYSTCFSKVYGQLDRISKGVDINVILKSDLIHSKSRPR